MSHIPSPPAWLVLAASLLLLPASLVAHPRHAAAAVPTTSAHQRRAPRSAHHEPAQRLHHTALHSGSSRPHPGSHQPKVSQRQVPQPTRHSISRPISRSIESPAHLRRAARRAPASAHSARMLRSRTTRTARRSGTLLSQHTPARPFDTSPATPNDFLAAANHTPAPVLRSPQPTPHPVLTPRIAHSTSPDRTTPIDQPPLLSVSRAATSNLVLPTLYNQRGRLVIPPPLLGSHEILVHQNEMADRDGLVRVQDDDSLDVMRDRRMLLPIPVSAALRVDPRLPVNRRYSRPWTTQFLLTLSHDFYARFQTPLQVNSAVRTVEFQERLLRSNGNAAPAEGISASPHLTGQAVDIAKHGLSRTEIAWLRGYLRPLIEVGSIDVEEEFQQSCFHISVYRRFAPNATAPEHYLAATRAPRASTALATAIR